ncbi:unnamed protein product, partial [Ectocarpus sp. 12 AP-2014]
RNPAQVQEDETNGKQPDKRFEQQQDKQHQQQHQQQDCHTPEPESIFRVTGSSAVDPPQSTLSHNEATNNVSIVAVGSQNRASA